MIPTSPISRTALPHIMDSFVATVARRWTGNSPRSRHGGFPTGDRSYGGHTEVIFPAVLTSSITRLVADTKEFENMRQTTFLAITLTCLWVSTAPGQERSPASDYAPEPVSIGYPLKAVPLGEVTLEDGFWAQRMKTHMEVTIPHVLRTLQIDYADPQPSRSALALVRTLEGAAYCLMMKDDPKLKSMMDKICSNIGDRCVHRVSSSCQFAGGVSVWHADAECLAAARNSAA